MAQVQVEVGSVSPLERFGDLFDGQVFKYQGTYWLKINTNEMTEWNAYTFDQWHVAHLPASTMVLPVNSKLIVEG